MIIHYASLFHSKNIFFLLFIQYLHTHGYGCLLCMAIRNLKLIPTTSPSAATLVSQSSSVTSTLHHHSSMAGPHAPQPADREDEDTLASLKNKRISARAGSRILNKFARKEPVIDDTMGMTCLGFLQFR